MKTDQEKKINIGDSVLFAIILRVCICFVAFVRVGKPFFSGIAIAVTVLLYIYLRKGNKRPYIFIFTMAIVHFIIAVPLVIIDRLATVHFVPATDLEMILTVYIAVILLFDLVITKIIKSRKPLE